MMIFSHFTKANEVTIHHDDEYLQFVLGEIYMYLHPKQSIITKKNTRKKRVFKCDISDVDRLIWTKKKVK